ncbi:MAG: hypothetical protein ACJA0N_001548 [Pseudohongiellaceae bacterium]|jgi:hypothetical protein
MTKLDKTIIGCIESCSLPDLGINDINVRVDTGAKTSSLHVDNLKKYINNGVTSVQFDIHPDAHNVSRIVTCHAKVADIRKIKSSNGESEQRYVIETPIHLGAHIWDIEITLTNRADMSYLMLLGREGLGDLFLVDPSVVFLI